MYVTRGGGVKKSENVSDVIYGSPLSVIVPAIPASSSLNFPLDLKVNELMLPIPLGARAEEACSRKLGAVTENFAI